MERVGLRRNTCQPIQYKSPRGELYRGLYMSKIDISFLNPANVADIEKGAIFPSMPDLCYVYLGEYLLSKGFKVRVFDEHIDGKIEDNTCLFTESRFVGVSLYGLNNSLVLNRMKNWKERFPETKFIIGGSSVGFDIPDKPNFIDYMVVGSGFRPLENLLGTGIIRTENVSMGVDIDFPAKFSLTPLSKYNSACLLTSFGCPFRCTFCLSNKLKKFQVRKKEYVFQELDIVLGSDIKYFEFFDDIFTLCPYMDELLSRVKRGNKRWGCVVDSRNNSEKFGKTLAKMIDSGLTTIGFGFESINNQSLRALNKKLTADNIMWSLKTVNKIMTGDLRPHAFLMYGLPFQTKDDHLRDIALVNRYGFASQSTHLKVIRGTDLWNIKDKLGIVIDDNGSVLETPYMTGSEINGLDMIMKKRNKDEIRAIWNGLL